MWPGYQRDNLIPKTPTSPPRPIPLLLYLQASGLRKAPLGEGGMPTQTEMGFGYPGSTERVSSLKRQYLGREVGSK